MWNINFLFLFFLVLTFSCNKDSTIRVAITPLNVGAVMDPSKVYFLNEYYLIENLSSRLVEMDAKLGYKLMLASSVTEVTKTHYQIKLKKSFFSNGEEITVLDVLKSFKRAMGEKNSHVQLSSLFERLEIEGSVLNIYLRKRVNDFLYYLTLIDLSVLHESQLKQELKVEDWLRVTSGAFTYEVTPDGKIFLNKNKYFKLANVDYPDRIELKTVKGRDSFKDFKDNVVDMGEFNLNSYDKHIDDLADEGSLRVIGNTGDMITFLALNVKEKKFSKEYNRRWILKKIIKNFKMADSYEQVSRKAYQFFTPQVRGFLDEDKILKEIESWDLDLSRIPDELKGGIRISTYRRAFEVTLKGVLNDLDNVLGIPVQIEDNVESGDFKKFIIDNKFESFLGVTSMDQVIVGESINLYYFSSFPMLKDVNGEIKKLMNEYKHSDSTSSSKIVNKISMQMIKDAECIPLFYVASPFFFNSKKLDISNLDELTYFNLWKVKNI